ncbi:hypothetical protein C7974DRAFT_452279 [Boeremia exigua]|uniref:uncharacterized protein n=1 Tax=Boeremia exigua TaxID=749465 RepID=UPI001E8E9192|nr:uncharacterized protein C7974DRAFT_452279 [Boeremia exigua]KAH6633093.1 hypothetical protein C7974DRAFT_452279 [Boeremia exigua]
MSRSQSDNPHSNVYHLPEGAIKRLRSDNDDAALAFAESRFGELPPSRFPTKEKLQKSCFDVVLGRLEVGGITDPHLIPKNFPWAVPRLMSDEASWRQLLKKPHTINANRLRLLIQLEQVNSFTRIEPNTVYFYIRSFTLTPDEVLFVLGKLVEESYDMNDKIYLWMETAEKARKAGTSITDTWTFRYCGMTEGSPLNRHNNDVKNAGTKPTWFSKFLKVVKDELPNVLQNAVVDIVSRASATIVLSGELRDLREKVLIALFGFAVVNMQLGGARAILSRNVDDEKTFLSLKTNTRNRLLKLLEDCPDDMTNGILSYGRSVKAYVDANPDSTGVTENRPYTERHLECVTEQAIPRVTPSGYSLILTVASDIGSDYHPPSWFYRSGRRSAEIVTDCLDTIINWEKSLDETALEEPTKALASGGYLPFADVFAWFSKNKTDFPFAGKHILALTQTTEPLILVMYGQLPSYLALNSFGELSSKWYYDTQHRENSEGGTDYFIRILGRPKIRTLGKDGPVVVVFPCHHPGYLSRAGLPAAKATKLFFMVHQIIWFAMDVVLGVLEKTRKSKPWTREQFCDEIVNRVEAILDPAHDFGKAFAVAQKECVEVTQAFSQAKLAATLAKSQDRSEKTRKAGYVNTKPEGWKHQRNRKSQFTQPPISSGSAIGGYALKIQKINLDTSRAPANDRERHILKWTEPATEETPERTFAFGPVVLPNGIVGPTVGQKFLWYTDEGIDLRDSSGKSLGERKALAAGKVKSCTFPISTLLLYSDIDAKEDKQFFENWESTTNIDIDELMLSVVSAGVTNPDTSEGYITKEWFAKSKSKHALPVPAMQSLHKATRDKYMAMIKTPANPGDLLWLFNEMFRDYYQKGDQVPRRTQERSGYRFILCSASERADSVYRMIAQTCTMLKYRNHPHWRTFLALANMSEAGLAERSIASNLVVLALAKLVANAKKENVSVNLKVGGTMKATGFWGYVIKQLQDFDSNAVSEVEAYELQCEVQIEEDSEVDALTEVSDEEGEGEDGEGEDGEAGEFDVIGS